MLNSSEGLDAALTRSINAATRRQCPVFECLMEEIYSYYERKVTNMDELKQRENKKLRGDVWEDICQRYLKARFADSYEEVWRWNQVPDELRKQLKLVRKEDTGIDLIVRTTSRAGAKEYIAVQCKLRKKGDLPWRTLSTFLALCDRTGPFSQHLIMTNAARISRQVPAGPKERAYCAQTFRGTKLHVWEAMLGRKPVFLAPKGSEKPRTASDLRLARLAFYDKTSIVKVVPLTPEQLRQLAELCRLTHSPINPVFFTETQIQEIFNRLRRLELETLASADVLAAEELRTRIEERTPDLEVMVSGLQAEFAFDGDLVTTITTFLDNI